MYREEQKLASWKHGDTPVLLFVQLCRQNDQSDNFKVFGSFESLIKAFDNIFGNYVLGSVSWQPAGRRLLRLLPAGWHYT